MVIKNQILEIFNQGNLHEYNSFHLSNCIVNEFDLVGVFELNVKLTIENCVINNFNIHSCWFVKGLILKKNVVNNFIDYQMGGHNNEPIIMHNNVFTEFFNFFDCQFANKIELKNNVFRKGSNLFGNKGEGFENSFVHGWIAENNVGRIDIDAVEM